MKKKSSKQIAVVFLFSVLLFGSLLYKASSSVILGASLSPEGNKASAPGDGNSVINVPDTAGETAGNIPEESSSTTVATGESTEQPKSQSEKSSDSEVTVTPEQVYIVKADQTLWDIAQENNLSLKTLMNQNQLISSVVVEGQELIIK